VNTTPPGFDSALAERDRLAELEQIVERGLLTFREVGAALLEIRERRLYRGTHATFEGYCRERWLISKRHANRLVQASAIAELVGPVGPLVVERQARELAPLRDEPELLREAVAEARRRAGGRPLTVQLLRETVGAIRAVHTPFVPLDEEALHRQRLARVSDELARLADDLDRLDAATLAGAVRGLARDVRAEAQS
jgi:hypothetical protein